jgi:IPT/TIG domain
MNRKTIFVIALVYLLAILTLGLFFFIKREWLSFIPDALGPIPVGVPWFGALGAVLISLTGVFEHEHDWDDGYWPWHIARPLIGIALGVVSVIILQAGVLAVGSTPQPQGSAIPRNLLYYLITFLVGYREETFRELIKRLVDVVLTPAGENKIAPTIQGVNPATAPHATSTPVVLTGSGFTGTQSVKFGTLAATFAVDSDGQLTAATPAAASAGNVVLTVTNKSGTATHQFTFT